VRRVGWSEVQHSIIALGWWYAPIVALGGVRFATRALAWQACAGGTSLSFARAFSATLAGDSLGNLTPFGVLASEPAKVFFVKDRVAMVAAVASVAAENAFYVISVMVMIGAGALTFFAVAPLPSALRAGAQLVLVGVLAGAGVIVWVVRRQPAFLSRLARSIARWTGRAATAPDRLRELEVHFYSLFTWPLRRIAQVIFWEAAFHAAAVAEVFLVLRLLSTASHVTLVDAFILETTGRLIVVAFKFVPYRLGVDEAGSAVVARALSLDPTLGVTLALVRRIRVLFWNAIGLLLLATRQR
jgi:glycosyltransferase 2 family protein